MKELKMEQIKDFDINSKVIVIDKLTGRNMGQCRVTNKGLLMIELVKEDKYQHLLKGDTTNLVEDIDVFTYWFEKLNRYQLYRGVDQYNEKEKFCIELISALKENIQSVIPTLRELLSVVSKEITEDFFDEIRKMDMTDNSCNLCCVTSGAVHGLKIEYDLETREWKIYFETEQEMSFHEAMKYLTDRHANFRVESVIMDDLIPKAIDYEDECSMSDDGNDSQEDFLDEFIKNDYNSMKDILKFITFYGEVDDIQELIENGRWFMENAKHKKYSK